MKLEKLVELEDERDSVKKAFKTAADEACSIANDVNFKCDWQTLEKLCIMFEGIHKHYSACMSLFTEKIAPQMKDVKDQIQQVVPYQK